MSEYKKEKKQIYILLISIHGLIRGEGLELGRDADTGGQTKYVLDLAKSLADLEEISRVDLVTRRVVDPSLSDDYAQPVESISEKARIVRIDSGPVGYIPKEQLWDYLDNFMDSLVNWLNEQPVKPDFVHCHYADAGYVGVKLSHLLSVPLIFTGHSLGRDKRKRLLAKGLSQDEIEESYNIARRIDAEEEVLANADLVITSTHNEIEDQYGLYNYYDPDRMTVIPPGTNLDLFYPPREGENNTFSKQLDHFLKDPSKPLILALSRPDERKNILTLVEAYGESTELQQKANLLVVAGTRDDITDLEKGAQTVFVNLLLLIDNYDLYGKIAIPKSHDADDVPGIYRTVAISGGVFINPALTEPFGLTILEAAASGLPVVATENGGPVDIIANCECGTLIDPLDKDGMTRELLRFLSDKDAWQCASENGIKNIRKHYSWNSHATTYIEKLSRLEGKYVPFPGSRPKSKGLRYRDRAIFSDLDQNLIGDQNALNKFISVIRDNRKCVSFGIATGRRIDSALSLMKKLGIPTPDILISSLGTRVHYGQNLTEDDFWVDHIDHDWMPRRTSKLLNDLPGLKRQSKSHQTVHKISYYYDAAKAPGLDEINMMLRKEDIAANVILSFGQFLDVIPTRASKGQALRYVAQRLDIPLGHILAAGGSGADEDMMRGNTLAVVVANRHNEELSQLVDAESIYFAGQPHASGILEALEYYDFFDACRVPDD